jgi:hypothetical protein
MEIPQAAPADWRSQMAALAKVFYRVFPTTITFPEALKELLIFGAAGLFVSLLLASYGLDLSAGLF